MKVDVIPGRDMPPGLLHTWSELQQANPSLANPFFRPEYMMAVASVRNDVFVAVIDRGEAFIPFQRSWLGLARPVGGLMTDYDGIISQPGMRYDPVEMVSRCGLKGWEFNNVPASQEVLRRFNKGQHYSLCLDIQKPLASLHNVIRKATRQRRQYEREHGPLRFEFDNRDPKMMDLLIELKSQQHVRTRATRVFSHRWTRALVKWINQEQNRSFAGVLSVLWSKDDPIALDFSLRSHGTLHGWFRAYSVSHRKLSPGTQLFLELVAAAPVHDIKLFDLGYGDESYKSAVTNCVIPLYKGFVSSSQSLTRWDNLQRRVYGEFEKLCFHPGAGAAGRFMYRTYGSWLLR